MRAEELVPDREDTNTKLTLPLEERERLFYEWALDQCRLRREEGQTDAEILQWLGAPPSMRNRQ